MTLVDSSVWIDYFRGTASRETDHLDALLGREPVLVGDVILTEVLQGFSNDRDFETGRAMLASLDLVEIGGRDIAVEAARNFRRLRALGITVCKTIDTLIATYCIQSDVTLLFSDRDFLPFVGHLGLKPAL